MKKIFSIAILALAAMVFTSCIHITHGLAASAEQRKHEYKDSKEYGKVIEKVIDAKDFTDVEVHGAILLTLDQSSDSTSYTVVTRGNEKNLDKYEVYVENGKLIARLKGNVRNVDDDTPRITVKVTVPSLAKIDISGACLLKQETSFHQRQTLGITASGATYTSLNGFETDALIINLSGASDVDLMAVKCMGVFRLDVSGASNIKGDVTSQCLTASVSGATDVNLTIDCSEDVTIEASGASDIELLGKCKNLNVHANKYSSDVDIDNLEVSGTKNVKE